MSDQVFGEVLVARPASGHRLADCSNFEAGGLLFGEVLERFLERFWRGLGRGFREVLGEVLKRFCIPKSY